MSGEWAEDGLTGSNGGWSGGAPLSLTCIAGTAHVLARACGAAGDRRVAVYADGLLIADVPAPPVSRLSIRACAGLASITIEGLPLPLTVRTPGAEHHLPAPPPPAACAAGPAGTAVALLPVGRRAGVVAAMGAAPVARFARGSAATAEAALGALARVAPDSRGVLRGPGGAPVDPGDLLGLFGHLGMAGAAPGDARAALRACRAMRVRPAALWPYAALAPLFRAARGRLLRGCLAALAGPPDAPADLVAIRVRWVGAGAPGPGFRGAGGTGLRAARASGRMDPAAAGLAVRGGTRGLRAAGTVLIYGLIALAVLTALATLAVDFGRVQVAKSQLGAGADAAARAGAGRLRGATGDGAVAARAAAVAAALMNAADGRPIALDPADVLVGNWDATLVPPFSTGRLPLNAVRVCAARTRAAGNAVPLALGGLIGLSEVDVCTSATARAYPDVPSGIIGIERVRFGSVGALARVHGDLLSNGDIDVGVPLGLLVGVHGDARSWGGHVRRGFLAGISGSTARLEEKLVFPPVVLPGSNDNHRIADYLDGDGDFTTFLGAHVPAGRYVVRDLTMLAGVAINVEGPVEFFVTGEVNIAAGVNLLGTPNRSAANFKVRVADGGEVNFLANLVTPIYMDLYAPDSVVDVYVGINRYQGSLVAKRLDVHLPVIGEIHHDPTLTGPGDAVATIELVE